MLTLLMSLSASDIDKFGGPGGSVGVHSTDWQTRIFENWAERSLATDMNRISILADYDINLQMALMA